MESAGSLKRLSFAAIAVAGLVLATVLGKGTAFAAPIPPSTSTIGYVTLSNIQLNGNAGPLLVVQPGQDVQVTASWALNPDAGTTVFTAPVAFEGSASPAGCFGAYGWISYSRPTGTSTVDLGPAPTTPGVYNVDWELGPNFTCADSWHGTAPGTVLAQIIVAPPATSSIGNVTLSNIKLNGTPGTVLAVQAGQDVKITASWTINPASGTTILTAPVGFQGSATPAGCFGNQLYYPTNPTGTSTIDLGNAPSTPGVYNVKWELGPQYTCAASWHAASPGTVLAQIIVPAPPAVSIATPAEGAYYAVNQSVTSAFSCYEGAGGSGISTCLDQGGNPSGTAIDTSTAGTYSMTVTATSQDGLTSSQTVNYTVAAAPTASITTPPDGANYSLGQVVNADYSCAEGAFGPGLAYCDGTVENGTPVDTSSVGTHSFTVIAASKDGQYNVKTVNYTVGYVVTGFLPPIKNAPAMNNGAAGRTYPVKWQLQDAMGQYINNFDTITGISVEQFDACGSTTGTYIDITLAGRTSFRYDTAGQQYIFNWASPATPGCYALTVTFDSGQSLSALFNLR